MVNGDNIINYFFRKNSDNKTINEINSVQVESSSNDVEHDKYIDKSVNCEISMLLNFLLSCYINNF